ncbi:MAG TPA: hypothetical protein VKA77_15120, partial [Mycobacterium sp.]|nr:hypothetical protein [Mycobacterium sp.]
TLVEFAARHRIVLVTIADLTAYRRRTEKLIDRVGQARLPLPHGEFTAVGYLDRTTGAEHIALVHGDPTNSDHVLVHVHTECLSGDVFGSLRCDCGAHLERAFDLIVENRAGVVIYLRDDHSRPLSLQCPPVRQRLDDVDTQILADLGIHPGATTLYPHPLEPRPRMSPSTNLPMRAPHTHPRRACTVRNDSPKATVLAVQVAGR